MSGVSPALAEGDLNGAAPFPFARQALIAAGLMEDDEDLHLPYNLRPIDPGGLAGNVEDATGADERPFVAFRVGLEHARRGEIREAYDRFFEAIELRPTFLAAHCNYAWMLSRLGYGERAISLYDNISITFAAAVDIPYVAKGLASALYNKAAILGELGRRTEEMAVYHQLLNRFGARTGSPVADLVTEALFNKALAFSRTYDTNDAIAIFDDLSRLGSKIEPSLRQEIPVAIATALYNKGVSLDRSAEALTYYDDLVARFRGSTELPIRVLVAKGLSNKGVVLEQVLGRQKDAFEAFDEVVTLFGAATDLVLVEQVAGAIFGKGAALGPNENAIGPLDELIARFGKAPELPLQVQVANALIRKGNVLGALWRTKEEISAYDRVVARFDKTSDPILRQKVATALVNKGVRLAQRDHFRIAVTYLRKALAFEDRLERIHQIHNVISEWLGKEKDIQDQIDQGVRYGRQMGFTRHELPLLPEGLSWPRDDFDQAPEFSSKKGGLARYLTRVWKPLIPYIDMATMREHWPAAARAITRQRRKLPAELLPPVQREVTDRAAAAVPTPGDRPTRVSWALNQRAYRARRKLIKGSSVN